MSSSVYLLKFLIHLPSTERRNRVAHCLPLWPTEDGPSTAGGRG